MKIFTAICGLMLIASLETGAKVQSNQSAAGLNDVNTERISPVNDSERLDRLEALVEERVSYTPQIHGGVRARFTLSVLLEPLSVPSLFRGEWRKPNSPSHRAGCCECFHPLPIRNSERPFAVRPPCFRQLPQTLPLKCTASVLCKFSSSYSQNSAFNNLCSFGSPLDNLRWVSQK